MKHGFVLLSIFSGTHASSQLIGLIAHLSTAKIAQSLNNCMQKSSTQVRHSSNQAQLQIYHSKYRVFTQKPDPENAPSKAEEKKHLFFLLKASLVLQAKIDMWNIPTEHASSDAEIWNHFQARLLEYLGLVC